MVSAEKQGEIAEYYRHKKEILVKITEVMDDIIGGMPESAACRKHGVPHMKFRTLFRSDRIEGLAGNMDAPAVPPVSWEEEFLHDLFGADAVPCPDFQSVYDKYTSEKLTERQKEAVRLRYEDGMTLRETGEALGVTQERARQIIAHAMRRLRGYQSSRAFAYGMEFLEKMEELHRQELEQNRELREKAEKIAAVQDTAFTGSAEIPLDAVGLSVRARMCLVRAGYSTVRDLEGMTLEKLMQVRNIGRKSVDEVVSMAARHGIRIEKENQSIDNGSEGNHD